MRTVTGPLQTGTYICGSVNAPDHFAGLSKDQSKFALIKTKNPQSEALKWSVERLDNDIFRFTAKGLNVTGIHNLEEQKITMGEGATNWIIRETDVPGEYCASPIVQPSLYVSMERHEEHVEFKPGAEKPKGRFFFLVDE
ncbi:hypothetical protein AX14_010989 [Amanita brunnescens Koide BX004]|nr:hypothetical protein AX14_010989 [Amanita brunnescens Koide BX004]